MSYTTTNIIRMLVENKWLEELFKYNDKNILIENVCGEMKNVVNLLTTSKELYKYLQFTLELFFIEYGIGFYTKRQMLTPLICNHFSSNKYKLTLQYLDIFYFQLKHMRNMSTIITSAKPNGIRPNTWFNPTSKKINKLLQLTGSTIKHQTDQMHQNIKYPTPQYGTRC